MSMHTTWMNFRSLTADQSVKYQKLKSGTVKRIITFAKPYKLSLILFMVTVIVDAFLIIATPLLLKKLIDEGVILGDGELVTRLAFLVAIIALLDAVFSIIGRWFSAKVGEGLIYDLRKLVFEHVQKQSIAFFTRTQTGALTSAACPLQDVIEDQTRQVLADLTSDVKINWVWLPPWGPN